MNINIILGFDDQGRQFDLHGNLVDWWQDDTEAKFASKAQCMVEQVIIVRLNLYRYHN